MARRRRRNRLWLVLVTLSVTLVATIAIGIQATPIVVRHVFLGRLTSGDPALREQGLNYIHRHAADPAVREAVMRVTADCDEQLLAYIAGAMHSADAWGPHIGRGWVRHLVGPLDQANATYRAGVAWDFADAASRGLAVRDDELLARTVEKLAADDDPNVRWYALRAAAALGGRSAVLDAFDGEADPRIAERVAAVRRLSDAGVTDVFDAAWRELGKLPPGLPEAEQQRLTEWRSIVLDPWPSGDEKRIAELLLGLAMRGPEADYLMAAAAWRAPRYLPKPKWDGDAGHVLSTLALFEAQPERSLDIESFEGMPEMMRVAALRAAKRVRPEDFMPAFSSEHAAVRHLAVMLAVERFDRPTLDRLARDLSTIFYDERRMSGALLIGLTGSPLDLLDERLKREHVWIVKQHLFAAEYMVGRGDGWAESAPEPLLARKDFPDALVYLALLHRGDRQGLDRLLKPIGSPGYDFAQTYAKWRYDTEQVREQLDERRFAPILRRYLPDAPPFWLWADADLQRFQVELIRNWYLMHRAGLRFDGERFTLE